MNRSKRRRMRHGRRDAETVRSWGDAEEFESVFSQKTFINIGRVRLPVGGNPDGSDLGVMWVQLFHPEDAGVAYGTSQGNRSISKNTVSRYLKDKRNGEWKATHQGLAFDVNGHLINGHHTCLAVIEDGKPDKVAIHFNCAPDSVYRIDFGRGRDAKDVLVRLGGFKNPRMTAATARCAIVGCLASSGKITTPEVVGVCERYQEQIEWVLRESGRLKGPITGAILRAVVHYGETPLMMEFCNHLRDGTNGGVDCPVNALQKYLAKAVSGKLIRTDHSVLYPRTIKALDAFLKGRKLKSLSNLPTEDIWPFDISTAVTGAA